MSVVRFRLIGITPIVPWNEVQIGGDAWGWKGESIEPLRDDCPKIKMVVLGERELDRIAEDRE